MNKQLIKSLTDTFGRCPLTKDQASKVGCIIGHGADGMVFHYDKNHVIKFSFLQNYKYDNVGIKTNIKTINEYSNILKFIRSNKPECFVNVNSYKIFFQDHSIKMKPDSIFAYTIDRQGVAYYSNYVLASYVVMPKLFKLSKQEYDSVCYAYYFVRVGGHYDKRDFVKYFKTSQFRKQIHNFAKSVRMNSKIECDDIHEENIMRDKNYNFKIIDLDRCYLTKHNRATKL